jgi:hypothetical protein
MKPFSTIAIPHRGIEKTLEQQTLVKNSLREKLACLFEVGKIDRMK